MLEPVLLSPLHPFLSLSSLFLFNILLSHKATTQTPSEGNSTFSNGGFFFCNKMGPLLASGAAHSRRSHGHGYYPTDLWPQVETHAQTLFQCRKHFFSLFSVLSLFSFVSLSCIVVFSAFALSEACESFIYTVLVILLGNLGSPKWKVVFRVKSRNKLSTVSLSLD